MKILVIGDTHLTENSIPELSKIIQEIYKIKADILIHLGDFFNSNRPTPMELKSGISMVKHLNNHFSEVHILAGNGTHETLHEHNIIDIFSDFSSVYTHGRDWKYYYTEKNYIRFGHYMTKQSIREYGSANKDVNDFQNLTFLGHQHLPQKISSNVYHLGSVRFVSFNELGEDKKVALINTDKNNEIKFIKLNSPIPMKDIKSLEELKNTDSRTKVRYKYKSWNQFKNEIKKIASYKDRFVKFQDKLPESDKEVEELKGRKDDVNSKEIIEEGIKKIKDKHVKKLIKLVWEKLNDK